MVPPHQKGFSNSERNENEAEASCQSQFNLNSKNFQNQSLSNQDKKQSSEGNEVRARIKNENWQIWEIKKLFTLYGEYGSQWKIIQIEFKQKSSNSIKNRFYTVVRTLLKALFRQHPNILNKIPHQIPSKIILKFFEGRQEFQRFKGFGKKILKSVNYDLESKKLFQIVENYIDQIKALHTLIFPNKDSQSSKKPKGRNIKSRKWKTLSSKGQNKIEEQVDKESIIISKKKKQTMTSPKGGSIDNEGILITGQQKQTINQGFIIIPPINYYTLIGYQFHSFP